MPQKHAGLLMLIEMCTCVRLTQSGSNSTSMVLTCGAAYAVKPPVTGYPPCFTCATGYTATVSGYCTACATGVSLPLLLLACTAFCAALLWFGASLRRSRHRRRLLARLLGFAMWLPFSMHVVVQVVRAGPPGITGCPLHM